MGVNYLIGAKVYTNVVNYVRFQSPGGGLHIPTPIVGPGTSNGDASGLVALSPTPWTPVVMSWPAPSPPNFQQGSLYIGIDFGQVFSMGAMGGNDLVFRIATGFGIPVGGNINDAIYCNPWVATGISGGLFTGLTPAITGVVFGIHSPYTANSQSGNPAQTLPTLSVQYLVLEFFFGTGGATGPTAGTLSITKLCMVGSANLPAAGSAWPAYTAPVTKITSAASATFTQGTGGQTYQITTNGTPLANGLITPYNATGLPTGMSLNTTTGLISGTPSANGTFNATVGATSQNVSHASLAVVFTVNSGAPVVNSGSITRYQGQPGTFQIHATHSPTSYAASGLPSGLNVDAGTGLVFGNIQAAVGTYTATISATNVSGTGSNTLTIHVRSRVIRRTPTTIDTPTGGPPGLIDTQNPPWFPVLGTQPGIQITDWIPYPSSTATWYAQFSAGPIVSLYIDGVPMQLVASIAAVDTSPGGWFYAAPYVYVQAPGGGPSPLPGDPNPHITMAQFQIYMVGASPDGIPLDLSGNAYILYLAKDGFPKITNALQDPFFGGVNASVGDCNLLNMTGYFDKLAARFRWEARGATFSIGGSGVPFADFAQLQQCVIFATSWTEKKFTISMRSQTDQLRTSFPAPTNLAASHITASYTFRHELVASFVNSVPAPVGGGGGQLPPSNGGGYLKPLGGGGAGYATPWNTTSTDYVKGTPSQITALQYTRHLQVRAPYSRSPTQIDPNAIVNATIGQTIPVLCGTCYACPGVVLAQSATERMIKVADHAIQGVFDAVASSGARASQQYHFHVGAVATTTTATFVIGAENATGTVHVTSGASIVNTEWISISDGVNIVVVSVTAGGGTTTLTVVFQQVLQGATANTMASGAQVYGGYNESDGIYQGEVRIDLENAVIHEVFQAPNHDIQLPPYVTAPWFLTPGVYSYDLYGAVNSDGTSMSNASDVVSFLMTKAGVTILQNAAAFAAAGVEADLYTVSLQLNSSTQPVINALSDLLRAVAGFVYMDIAGTLVFAIQPPNLAPTLTLSDATGDILDLKTAQDMKQVATTIACSYPAPVSGGQSVAESAIPLVEALGLKLIASAQTFNVPLADSGSAMLAACQMIRRRMKPQNLTTITTGLKVCGLNIFDIVKVVHNRMPVDAFPYLIGRVQSIELDFNTNRNVVTIDDNKTVLEVPFQAFLKSDDIDLTWADATALQKLTTGFWADDAGCVITNDWTTYRKGLYY